MYYKDISKLTDLYNNRIVLYANFTFIYTLMFVIDYAHEIVTFLPPLRVSVPACQGSLAPEPKSK